jgi:chromosome segregation ATPase
LGIVFIAYDLVTFLRALQSPPDPIKKSESLEDKILALYGALDESEKEIRSNYISDIRGLCDKLVTKIDEKVKKVNDRESELKQQILRLTKVIAQCRILKTKTDNNKKLEDVSPDITKIYQSTQLSIYDLNIDILKLKNSLEDILSDAKAVLEMLT